MARKSEPTLEELRKEVEKLKKEKEREFKKAKTIQERNRLLSEINQLKEMKKSPSSLKRFGNTYMKGLKKTGKMLWGGIKSASGNLDRNAPEYREMSRGMTRKPKPISPMAQAYLPSASDYYATTPRKMKTISPSKPKRKSHKTKKHKKGFRVTDKATDPMMWELP